MLIVKLTSSCRARSGTAGGIARTPGRAGVGLRPMVAALRGGLRSHAVWRRLRRLRVSYLSRNELRGGSSSTTLATESVTKPNFELTAAGRSRSNLVPHPRRKSVCCADSRLAGQWSDVRGELTRQISCLIRSNKRRRRPESLALRSRWRIANLNAQHTERQSDDDRCIRTSDGVRLERLVALADQQRSPIIEVQLHMTRCDPPRSAD